MRCGAEGPGTKRPHVWNTLLSVVIAAAGLVMVGSSTAHADLAKFPDLDAFDPVDPARYTADVRASGAAYFLTPEGLQCVKGVWL